MREIKFRAWDKQENKMLWRKLFDMNWYATERNDEEGSHCWGAISGGQSRFLEIMQFTGLKDKDGKEIYEGDFLVEAEDPEPMRHRIVWYDDQAKFELETLEDEEGHWGALIIDSLADLNMREFRVFRVIGNIYENPELLNQPSTKE